MYGYYHHGWGGPGGMMGWGFGWLISLIVLIVLIWLIVRLVGHSGSTPVKSDSAQNILRERYAKGEIGKEEFDAKMKDLK